MSPQNEEVTRLRERYVTALGDPLWESNLKILRSALKDRMIGILPGKDLLLYPPTL